MHTLREIVEQAKRLPLPDRRRVIEDLQVGLSAEDEASADSRRLAALDRWIALAGTRHSAHTDVSADKYRHLAEAYGDNHEPER